VLPESQLAAERERLAARESGWWGAGTPEHPPAGTAGAKASAGGSSSGAQEEVWLIRTGLKGCLRSAVCCPVKLRGTEGAFHSPGLEAWRTPQPLI